MGSADAEFAIFLLIAFLAGVLIGVIGVTSLASRREDRLYSLTGEAPGPACEGTRVLTGAHTRGTGFLASEMRPGWYADTDADGKDGEDEAEDAQGQEWVG
jgi:hypothetical protein